jgi:hypothetical protein
MATFMEWLDEAIDSQKTLVQEYESDPAGENFKAALEGLERLTSLKNSIISMDLEKEEKLRSLDIRERELMAKIDETNDRIDLEHRRMIMSFGGMAGFVIFVTVWESYGHLFKDSTVKAFNTLRRAVGL